jgi:hypothetical protein
MAVMAVIKENAAHKCFLQHMDDFASAEFSRKATVAINIFDAAITLRAIHSSLQP